MKSSNGYRRHGRWAGYGTVGVAAAAALVMVLSPFAGASVTHTPPFKGTAAVISPSTSTGGSCKSFASATSMHWIPKTGNVTGSVASYAKGCTTFFGPGYSSGYAFGEIAVALPLHFKVNGAHNISIGSSYAYTVTASKTGSFSCPIAKNVPGTYTYSDCYADVSASAFWEEEIYDKTNNSYLYSGSNSYVQGANNYSYQDNYSDCNGAGSCYNSSYAYSCSNQYYYYGCVPSGTAASGSNTTWINTGANCGYSYAGHCSYWNNWTLNASHSLWVVMFFEFYADSYQDYFPAGNTVSAAVNGATLGNTGWKITSVTVA